MSKPNDKIRKKILAVLQNTHISNITQTAKKAGTTRITANKHLERLVQEGKLREYRVGRARIFVIRGGEEK